MIDGIATDDGIKILNKFKDYFVKVGPRLASEITESDIYFHTFLDKIDNPRSSSFVIDMTFLQGIVEISKQLRSSHSSGIDNIKPHSKDHYQRCIPTAA